MAATDTLIATPRATPSGRWTIVLAPVSHPELAPIQIQESLFAIGRTEAPFDTYPFALAGDLSRRHARIFCEHGAVYFAELGSKNGSTVNGMPVKQAITTLHDGDLLGLGKTLVFRVQFESAGVQAQAQQARLASLTLRPENVGAGLLPIVVTEFPFLVSKADDTFARYKETEPAQVNYLSRRHAHIFLKGGQLHIEDLGSTNGTFVNGTRLDEHALALHEGDVLAFGGRYFVYRIALAWETLARDPTLTRIGATQAPAAGTSSSDDRTTFVAAADSFLDIFCVDPAPAPDATPEAGDRAASDTGNEASARPQSRTGAMLSGLYAAFGGKGAQGARRLRNRALGAVALVIALVWVLYRVNGPEREVEHLLAARSYAQAAVAADDALANDPGDSRLRTLSTEAVLKAHLPAWIALLKARQFEGAAQRIAAMRRHLRHNPELAPLLDQLAWIGALEAFVAGRGGAQSPSRDALDAAKVAQFLKQWDERGEAYQRGFETMAAHVPAFRDAYADALSDIRRLALAKGQA
jgi:pSer/pThr/pTyr-binding forkhead associated (FHA) protein